MKIRVTQFSGLFRSAKALLLLATLGSQIIATSASAGDWRKPGSQIYTERCSSNVAIPQRYHLKPDSPGTIILPRPAHGYSAWTPPIRVFTDSKGRIRWSCQSTKGNFFDLGTWKAKVKLPETFQCALQVVGGGDAKCLLKSVTFEPGGKAYKGFTDERTRVKGRRGTADVQFRFGPNRLFQIRYVRGTSF